MKSWLVGSLTSAQTTFCLPMQSLLMSDAGKLSLNFLAALSRQTVVIKQVSPFLRQTFSEYNDCGPPLEQRERLASPTSFKLFA
jgi:hypothetical protein